jgi:hypothetical protein
MNAFSERFVQSIKHECLDRIIVLENDHLCAEYLAHYRTERSHQECDNEVLIRLPKRTAVGEDLPKLADIRGHPRLGGLLKSDSRTAA